ncbi:MAG: TolC family protein [Phycisphaeraceae bacterium]|nr:TolC family protein [Phycisphaeraceae bacterium]
MTSTHRLGLAFLLFGGLALLVGCQVDPAKEIAAYRQVVDDPATKDMPALNPAEALTLSRALAMANRDHERLNIAGEDYLQAIIARKRIAAEFLPTVSLVPTFYKRDPVSGVDHHNNRYTDVPAQGSYVNFNAIRSMEDLGRSASTVEQRKALLLNVRASLLLDAARAYYQVLRSFSQVSVLENSLALQEERVRDVEAQIAAGTGRELDLAQAQAQAASTRVLVVQVKGDVRKARSLLALLVAVPRLDNPLQDDFIVPAQIPSLAEMQAQAVAHRQDLAAAAAAVTAAQHGVQSAFAQYYPSVSLNLNVFAYRESVPPTSIYTALVQANVPIFTGGRIHQDVRAAWSVFRQTKLTESLTRRQVLQDVESAYEDLRISEGRLRELDVNVKAAQQAFEQAADLVRVGRATNLERLVAQDQLLSAQLRLTSEQFDRKVAYLNLQRLAGLLAPMPLTETTTQPAATTQP